MTFTIRQLQAVNNWQRGFSPEQKVKRTCAVRLAAATMDKQFRHVDRPCYRQLALEPKYVMRMGLEYELKEAVSSWTLGAEIAEEFKGGVTPKGESVLPVIFCVSPEEEQVLLNISALYASDSFLKAVAQYEKQITGFSDGIGRYRDSQAEVILELPKVCLRDVYAIGGHSSDPSEFLGRPEIKAMLEQIDQTQEQRIEQAMAEGEGLFGPRWVKGERKNRLLQKWIEEAERVSTKHNSKL